MKFREGVQVAVGLGKELIQERRNERLRREADLQAYEERIAREQAAALQRHREERRAAFEAEQPQIDALNRFAGRLVLITNPQNRLGGRPGSPGEKLRGMFSGAIGELFVPGAVGVSSHASPERMNDGIQQSLTQVVDVLRLPLGSRGIWFYQHNAEEQAAGTYVAKDADFRDSLVEAVQDTDALNSLGDTYRAEGHIAVVSALGVHHVGLDYYEARFGKAYMLDGIDEDHQFLWREVFDIPGTHTELWAP